MGSLSGIGLFGGTFDPVHIGHLRVALELKWLLGLAETRLIPCADPPHRDTPLSSSSDRLAMLQLAVANVDGLVVDDCELQRPGPSYSIDTLIDMRSRVGSETPLFFCIGMDALVSLDTWHRWQALTEYANIVVAARPGWQRPQQGIVANWLKDYELPDLQHFKKSILGHVFIAEMTLLPISSTAIRRDLLCGISPQFLMPDAVIDYIKCHRLYVGS